MADRPSVTPNSTELKRLRLSKAWTQQRLADESGLSRRTIQEAEAGESVDMETVRILANLFQVEYLALVVERTQSVPIMLYEEPDGSVKLVIHVELTLPSGNPETSPKLKAIRDFFQAIFPGNNGLSVTGIATGAAVTVLLSSANAKAIDTHSIAAFVRQENTREIVQRLKSLRHALHTNLQLDDVGGIRKALSKLEARHATYGLDDLEEFARPELPSVPSVLVLTKNVDMWEHEYVTVSLEGMCRNAIEDTSNTDVAGRLRHQFGRDWDALNYWQRVRVSLDLLEAKQAAFEHAAARIQWGRIGGRNKWVALANVSVRRNVSICAAIGEVAAPLATSASDVQVSYIYIQLLALSGTWQAIVTMRDDITSRLTKSCDRLSAELQS